MNRLLIICCLISGKDCFLYINFHPRHSNSVGHTQGFIPDWELPWTSWGNLYGPHTPNLLNDLKSRIRV